MYWLLPPTKIARRAHLEWIVIEEPEMGLHPDGISATLALVLEMLDRGYRVCLSTHSPHVLDVLWAMQVMKAHDGLADDVLDLFSLRKSQSMRALASNILEKDFRVFYFRRDGQVADISKLDPGSEDSSEAGWGGLSGFSGNVGDIVARVVERSSRSKKDGARP
jgi:hypothetical protein